MLISIHILNLLIALIDMKEGWSLSDMANVKSLPFLPAALDCVQQNITVLQDEQENI